jgi:hypothetical protein
VWDLKRILKNAGEVTSIKAYRAIINYETIPWIAMCHFPEGNYAMIISNPT